MNAFGTFFSGGHPGTQKISLYTWDNIYARLLSGKDGQSMNCRGSIFTIKPHFPFSYFLPFCLGRRLCHCTGASISNVHTIFLPFEPSAKFPCLHLRAPSPAPLYGLAKRWVPGLVNFVPAVAYHFCLNLPAAFSQPENGN